MHEVLLVGDARALEGWQGRVVRGMFPMRVELRRRQRLDLGVPDEQEALRVAVAIANGGLQEVASVAVDGVVGDVSLRGRLVVFGTIISGPAA